MKIQFDPNQAFQLDAVAAVTDLFDGQPRGASDFSVTSVGNFGELFAGQEQTQLGLGNRLQISADRLRENLRLVQARNDIEVSDPNATPDAWELVDEFGNVTGTSPHFSVEMETGTGKTYVYLRTIFELSQRYGFQKFVIVVPSVAIREGVLKNIEITAEHFRSLYNNLPFEHFVYDAKRVNRLRQFATSTTLQILIINIDAFRKNFTGTEGVRKSNVIYKESDKLSGRQPIEFAQAARPIVIIDEPQSVDSTEKAQEAIKALNPLCTLRYSATHKNAYNLVYKLGPVKAFELKLVKQIVVGSALSEDDANNAFVRVVRIDYKPKIQAKLRIHAKSQSGTREKSVTARMGSNLYPMSGERSLYQDGYEVAEISAEPGNEYVRFSNGRTVRTGEEIGGLMDDVWRAQIKHTVKKHLDKEIEVSARGLKVLSLFFIDRVANYRDHDEGGSSAKGKFAVAIEETLKELSEEAKYQGMAWLRGPLELVHNGYFAKDKKGVLKDTKGDTQADDDVYNLIMKDKERLLSLDEPLRFLFSHSALREGWDNPNVFQICTLNESRSAIKKRQEIGRGLRLPVDHNGLRVFDESINKLYVMANESYEDFARALQTEYEEDCGVTFGKVPFSALMRITRVVDGVEQEIGQAGAKAIRSSLVRQAMMTREGLILPAFQPSLPDFRLELPEGHEDLVPAVVDLLASYQIERHILKDQNQRPNRLKKEVTLSPEFQALWDRIKPKTTYRVEFATDVLVTKAIEALKAMEPVTAPIIRISAGHLQVGKAGVSTRGSYDLKEDAKPLRGGIPDLLAYLQNETELTRSTLVRILRESGRLAEVFLNPQRFLDQVAGHLKRVLHDLIVDGIKYERIQEGGAEAEWEMLLFKNDELVNYLTSIQVGKSVYEYVVYDSEVERAFAKRLNERDDIKLLVKLPRWFVIDTPLGTYNPDWAIVKHDSAALYLVRETKSTRDFMKLRSSESAKVRCGAKHFEALGVDFNVVVRAEEV